MRPFIAIALVVLATAMTLGCGGSHQSRTTNAHAAPYAHAVNLRAAELPASQWLAIGPESEAHVLPGGGILSRCEGSRPETNATTRITSPLFRLKPDARRRTTPTGLQQASAESTVYVMQNHALAEQDFTAASECVARTGRGILFVSLHLFVPGAEVVGQRFRQPRLWSSKARQHACRYTGTASSFVVGRAEIALHATGVAQPFPRVTEERLLSLLYRRATAHRL